MSPPRSIMDGVTLVNVSKVQRPTPDQWPKSELTGEPVDPYSEAWRHECECRHILDKMGSRAERAAYIAGVEDRRGKPSADRIRADILFLHYFRQAEHCESREELDDLTARIWEEQRSALGTNDLINRIVAEWFRRIDAAV